MNINTTTITIDVGRNTLPPTIFAKQYDTNSRFIEITIKDKGGPYIIGSGITARLEITKPDGRTIFNNAKIQNNKVIAKLTTQALTTHGTAIASISLWNGAVSVLSTQNFYINIQANACNYTSVISSDEFQALQEALVNRSNSEVTKKRTLEVMLNDPGWTDGDPSSIPRATFWNLDNPTYDEQKVIGDWGSGGLFIKNQETGLFEIEIPNFATAWELTNNKHSEITGENWRLRQPEQIPNKNLYHNVLYVQNNEDPTQYGRFYDANTKKTKFLFQQPMNTAPGTIMYTLTPQSGVPLKFEAKFMGLHQIGLTNDYRYFHLIEIPLWVDEAEEIPFISFNITYTLHKGTSTDETHTTDNINIQLTNGYLLPVLYLAAESTSTTQVYQYNGGVDPWILSIFKANRSTAHMRTLVTQGFRDTPSSITFTKCNYSMTNIPVSRVGAIKIPFDIQEEIVIDIRGNIKAQNFSDLNITLNNQNGCCNPIRYADNMNGGGAANISGVRIHLKRYDNHWLGTLYSHIEQAVVGNFILGEITDNFIDKIVINNPFISIQGIFIAGR